MKKSYTKYLLLLIIIYWSGSTFAACPSLSNNLTAKDEEGVINEFKSYLVNSDIQEAGFFSSPGAPIPLLHLGVSKGCFDFVKYFISIHGIKNVSVKNLAGMNVLHIAIDKGHKNIVKLLLESGADPSATIDKMITLNDGEDIGQAKILTNVTSLDLAKMRGDKDIIKLLEKNSTKSWWPF